MTSITVNEENKPRLYNPETGECLNDKTMKVIQDMRSGKEPVYEMKSMDDFKNWCESLWYMAENSVNRSDFTEGKRKIGN